MRQLIYCALTFLILLPTYAANLSSYTSTSTPVVGESFDLFISSKEPFKHQPDTTILKKNFEVFGLSQSSQIKMINNQTQAEYQWIISLAAKKTGKITIPALYVGQEKTHAIALNVVKTSASSTKSQDVIELTSKVSPKAIYPQQQLTYTVTLKIAQSVATRLKNASLSLPTVENAIIKPLGNDKKYQQQSGHTTYTIIERRYAIFPQHSGSLTINAPLFQGEIDTHHSGSFSFPFGFAGQAVKKTAPATTLTVNPAPNTQGAWLPAKSVTLQGAWEQTSPKFQVGTPVIRMITLEATGLLSTQLPKINLDLNKANVYPEQPQLEDFEKGNDFIGLREETFAVIPIQAGPLTLPEIKITWWNITKKRFEVAILPAETIQVKAAPSTKNSMAPHNKDQHQQKAPTAKPSNSVHDDLQLNHYLWPIISLLLLTLWLITLFYYRYRYSNLAHLSLNRQEQPEPASKTISASKKALKSACFNNDPHKTKAELLKLAYELWQLPTPNLLALAPFISDSALQALTTLNQNLYAQHKNDWCGKEFWRLIAPELKRAQKKHKERVILPPLYPS